MPASDPRRTATQQATIQMHPGRFMRSRTRWLMYRCLSLGVALSFAMPVTATEAVNAHLQQILEKLASNARPGVLGITILDLDARTRAQVNADRAYPMMSVFKAPVAAAVLADIDAGRIAHDQQVTIDRQDIVDGAAVPSIGAKFKGQRMHFTVDQLLLAAVSESDNTAVDALIKLLGGPSRVTEFLRAHGIEGMRIDLSEADVGRIFDDTASGQAIPPDETDQATLARQRRGYQSYLKDPRNRSTPDAAADFLEKLWTGQLLSRDSTNHLLALMYGQTKPSRLRAGLPASSRLADKCGTSYSLDGETAAFNDIGIITSANGHTMIVAAFLTASRADKDGRNALFAEIGKVVAEASLAP